MNQFQDQINATLKAEKLSKELEQKVLEARKKKVQNAWIKLATDIGNTCEALNLVYSGPKLKCDPEKVSFETPIDQITLRDIAETRKEFSDFLNLNLHMINKGIECWKTELKSLEND